MALPLLHLVKCLRSNCRGSGVDACLTLTSVPPGSVSCSVALSRIKQFQEEGSHCCGNATQESYAEQVVQVQCSLEAAHFTCWRLHVGLLPTVQQLLTKHTVYDYAHVLQTAADLSQTVTRAASQCYSPLRTTVM